MAEREQEREDYESKINELKIILNRKSTQVFDEEDNNLKEVDFKCSLKFSFF